MQRRRSLVLIVVSLGFILGAAPQDTRDAEPLLPQIDRIGQLVLNCQVPAGGIARTRGEMRDAKTFLTSYSFGGLALAKAYQMTGKPEYAQGSKRFIEFWMDHQNARDRWGVVGSMYDLDYTRDGTLQPHVYGNDSSSNAGGPGYDAADADPPMIAAAADAYVQATGDVDLLKRYAEGFDRIGQCVAAMLQSDGLTFAHPNYKMKYLMDAAEAHAGFVALHHIFQACGDATKAAHYAELAARMEKGIGSLWSEKNGCYDWVRDEAGGQQHCDWRIVYPDTTEQLWPALWGIDAGDSPRTRQVWKGFVAHWPHWAQADDFLTWPAAGLVALRAGDVADGQTQTRRILEKEWNNDAWEVNQMYFTMLNCCDDFELTGNAHVVEGSLKQSPGKLTVNLQSPIGGKAQVALRLPANCRATISIDGAVQPPPAAGADARAVEPLHFAADQTLKIEIRLASQ